MSIQGIEYLVIHRIGPCILSSEQDLFSGYCPHHLTVSKGNILRDIHICVYIHMCVYIYICIYGRFHKSWVLFAGVLVISALLFAFYIRAPNLELPYPYLYQNYFPTVNERGQYLISSLLFCGCPEYQEPTIWTCGYSHFLLGFGTRTGH